METVVIILCIVGYTTTAGAVRALFYWLYPPTGLDGEPEYSMGGVLWPVVLPAVLGNFVLKRLFGTVDARRDAAEKEAAELKRRIAELDEELRVSKSPEDPTKKG